jgi:hypothetical protein
MKAIRNQIQLQEDEKTPKSLHKDQSDPLQKDTQTLRKPKEKLWFELRILSFQAKTDSSEKDQVCPIKHFS